MPSAKLRVPVPSSILSAFMVPMDSPLEDPLALITSAVKAHIHGASVGMILELFNTGVANVHVLPMSEAPPFPVHLFSSAGASDEHIQMFSRASHTILIIINGEPGWPPAIEMFGAAAAGAVAAQLGTVIMEARIPAVLTAEKAMARVPGQENSVKFSDMLQVLVSQSGGGLWFTTKGLYRVGLPELQAVDVPPQLSNTLTKAITGLAWKLAQLVSEQVDGNADAQYLDLSFPINVTADDVIEAYVGEAQTKGGPVNFYLTLQLAEGDTEPFLTIVPAENDLRSPGEYLFEICAEMFGTSESGIVEARLDDAMEEAMAQAIEQLPDIRARFVNNQLPRGAQLVVKFPATDGTNVEYLWAFVTSWDSPTELQCYCGNHSRFDPNLKAGQAMTLSSDVVVDWIVTLNETVIEGGWTNKVLGN